MKSSSRESKETSTGQEATTSPETDKYEYVSNRDCPFGLEQLENGLWKIKMLRGGHTPRICDGTYTSKQFAERDLISYLHKNDRLGFAKWPGKESSAKS